MKVAVWIARLLLGGTFLLSGVTKMVDPYGSLTKIEAYLNAWGLADVIPPGLTLLGGCALALVEFIIGLLLSTGSLRRFAPWGAAVLMAFMLPLTVYIAIANPVDDCGCFGDFLILSNRATMVKNIILMALALFLCRCNRRAHCLFAPWIQWVEIAAGVAYMLLLAIIGYHVQPLLDFRAYPVGEPLTDIYGAEALYIYSRNGVTAEFTPDNLPDEADGWEFVDVVTEPSGKLLALFDRHTGEEVTDSVIGATAGQMLLLFPYPAFASASGSFTANELQQAMETRFGPGSFIAVTAADSAAVERAVDLMMATYPVYYADNKAISAVARGHMAVVYLKDGIVAWKRTLSSINLDRLTSNDDIADIYAVDGPGIFRRITLLYLTVNLILIILGLTPYLTRLRRRRKR